MDLELSVARDAAVEAAEAAGDLVRDGLFGRLDVSEKGVLGDVVTNLDFESEKLIIAAIRERFPGHRVISEEQGVTGGNGTLWTWVIDPIDGTNNVAIGLPVLTVGISLCHDDIPVVGVVHDPISRRTWSAILGRGAEDNSGLPMGRRRNQVTSRPLLAWIQGYGVSRDDRGAQAVRLVLARNAHRLLDLWAPLTCWMMLARGDIDGIVGYRIGEIDLHAGALIAGEAGLAVQDFSGNPFVSRLRDMSSDRSIVAGSSRVVEDLAEMLVTGKRLAEPLGDLMTVAFPEL
jgi:myo-inositol-1(or 4)-monophosphatase